MCMEEICYNGDVINQKCYCQNVRKFQWEYLMKTLKTNKLKLESKWVIKKKCKKDTGKIY